MLYIVATPIGNLEDITLRAIRILGEVDYIACEDTRISGVLLNHLKIKKPLISYHSHSGNIKTDKIISLLCEGKNVALISDAGTPGISDPGFVLVNEALKHNIEIIPIPGVTAFTTALMSSGMQTNHFLYLGFLPIKKGRQTILKELGKRKNDKTISETIVIYESVHRIERTLKELLEYFSSDLYIVVARELTKKYEEYTRGNLIDVIQFFEENPSKVKGEFVIMF